MALLSQPSGKGKGTTEQIQKVVNNLTLMMGERDDEVHVLRSINRELQKKVNEVVGVIDGS